MAAVIAAAEVMAAVIAVTEATEAAAMATADTATAVDGAMAAGVGAVGGSASPGLIGEATIIRTTPITAMAPGTTHTTIPTGITHIMDPDSA
jgi:methyl coenzyme M reductase subunit C